MWPTMRCCGRTARPSRCQPRTIDSQARRLGVPRRRRGRLGHPRQLGRGGDVAASARRRGPAPRRPRPGTPRARACPGRRGRRAALAGFRQVADGEPPGRVRAAEEGLDVAPGRCRRSPAGARRSARSPRVPDRPQQRHRQRAGPDPGLDHPRARGRCRPSRRSGRRPWGRPRRRRGASTARSRPAAGAARGTRSRRCCVTTVPSGRPISSSCRNRPRWVWNSLPGASVIVCSRPFGSVSCTRSPSPARSRSRRWAAPRGRPVPRTSCSGGGSADPRDVSARPDLLGGAAAAVSVAGRPGSVPHGCRPRSRRPGAADFMQCPLLYRFRVVDRLPEAPSAGGGPRHRGARRPGAAVRPAGAPSGRSDGRARCSQPAVGAGPSGGARAGGAVRRRRRGRRGLARAAPQELLAPLVRAGGPDPAGAGRARAVRRDHARRRPAAARATSTGWTSRPTGGCGSSTTRPGARRARRSRPRRCSR